MKLVVFSENSGLRKHLEDLLTSTPHNFQTFDVAAILHAVEVSRKTRALHCQLHEAPVVVVVFHHQNTERARICHC